MAKVWLDLDNPVFQENLLTLEKPERRAALDALNKIRQLSWNQVYRDHGLNWDKITSAKPPQALTVFIPYASLRHVEQPLTATGSSCGFLTVQPDHDATYGRK